MYINWYRYKFRNNKAILAVERVNDYRTTSIAIKLSNSLLAEIKSSSIYYFRKNIKENIIWFYWGRIVQEK